MAYCRIVATTRKWDHVSVTFSGIKVKMSGLSTLVYIYLHASSDLRTHVYTCLVTRLHSSTFVYIRL